MKYFKILPAAASIIALTATIGFSRDMRESDEAAAFRIRVETRESNNSANDITAYALPVAQPAQTGQIYRVEIEHGYETRVVSIDAYTGKILGNAKGPDKKA